VAAVWVRLRADLRARWLSWAALGVLIGVLASVVVAAAAGARRTDSAYPRLVGASNQADELVFDSTPNPQLPTVDGDQVEALPQVSQGGRLRAYSTLSKGVNAFGSPTGDAYMATGGVNRAHVRSGRAFDPHNPNEVMIDYSLADQNHLGVGDTLKLQFVPPAAGGPTSVADFTGKPTEVSFRVVGVVATPGQFPPQSGFYFSGPAAYLTPAFVRAHGADIASYRVSVVRLRHGRADEAAFLTGVRHLGGPDFQPISFPLAVIGAGTQHNLHLQAVALWLLAALLSVVILLMIVQLLTRQAALDSTEWPALWAMGVTRPQLLALGLGRSLWMAVPAAVIAVVGAIVLSPFAPIGLAAKAEINPGMAFDTAVLLIGAAVVLAAVVVISAWPIWRAAVQATQSLTAGEEQAEQRAAAVARRIGSSALPVTLTAGVSMALEPGRGRTAVPVRSTLVGATVGMVALTAALTFGSSLHHLISTPQLYGVGWHADIQNDNGPAAAALALPILHDDRDVEAYSWLETNTEGKVGSFNVGMQVIEPIQGTLVPGILAGRAPAADDEIALGATTMRRLHTHIGATIRASTIGASSPLLPARVVGRAVLVPGEASGHLGEGAVVTPGGLVHFASGATTTPPFVLAVKFRAGVNVAAATKSLGDRLVKVDGGFEGNVNTPTPPTDLLDFGHVSYLPFVLGGILAGLAVLTLGHLLFTSIRRRRRDLAIMKTLGFVRSQVGRTVAWQATTLMAVALIVGVPFGVVAGRVAWSLLAHQLGVLPEPVIPMALIALVIPAMLVLANLVAVLPAGLAARTRPALVLRSE